ncbi:MAG: PQQ-binding-like beta-propeller repeat protein [Pseudomonadales bacterium]|nr:PQQ-binding-like beta-propeller repeat protein [Pseudomonadales bacterium]
MQINYNRGDVSFLWGTGLDEGFYNWAIGGLTLANGVVFAGVSNLKGTMVAMDAETGAILWRYNTGQSVVCTPAVVDGHAYWGTGYKYGTPGNRVYNFTLP